MKKTLLIFILLRIGPDIYCQSPMLQPQYDSALYKLFPYMFKCEEFGGYYFSLEWWKPLPKEYKRQFKTIGGNTYYGIGFNPGCVIHYGHYFHKGREYMDVYSSRDYYKYIYLRYEDNKVYILNDTVYTHWINTDGDTTLYDTSKVEKESLLFDFVEEEGTKRFMANNKLFFRQEIQLAERIRWHNNLTGDTILTYIFTPEEKKDDNLRYIPFDEIKGKTYIKVIRISKKNGIVEIAINYRNSWGDLCRCRPHDGRIK